MQLFTAVDKNYGQAIFQSTNKLLRRSQEVMWWHATKTQLIQLIHSFNGFSRVVTEAYFNMGKLLTRILQLGLDTYLLREAAHPVETIQNYIAVINYNDTSPSSRKEYQDLE